jgi:hypothetical protein
MLTKTLAQLTIGTAFLLAFSTPSAGAATITQNILVTITSGTLTGNIYTGSFSYDDSPLTPPPFTGNIPVTALSFLFQGTTYTEADGAPVAFYDNGTFLGLDFAVATTPQPTFLPGINSLSESIFAYDLGSSSGGGTVTYTEVTGTPEPTAVLGLLSLGLLFVSSRVQRKLSQG